MFKTIWYVILANQRELLFVFILSFISGFTIAIATSKLNKEKRKKGFRNGMLYGKTKEIDRQMYKSYIESRSVNDNSMYLKDSIEHHANKKF